MKRFCQNSSLIAIVRKSMNLIGCIICTCRKSLAIKPFVKCKFALCYRNVQYMVLILNSAHTVLTLVACRKRSSSEAVMATLPRCYKFTKNMEET